MTQDFFDKADALLPVYDRQGNRIPWREYSQLKYEDPEYYRVAATTVGDIWVSTVWLGMDHDMPLFHDENARYQPVIFETMCFRVEGGKPLWGSDLYSDRYRTVDAALAGHDQAVMWAREQEQGGALPPLEELLTHRDDWIV